VPFAVVDASAAIAAPAAAALADDRAPGGTVCTDSKGLSIATNNFQGLLFMERVRHELKRVGDCEAIPDEIIPLAALPVTAHSIHRRAVLAPPLRQLQLVADSSTHP
jgi:hypothetical protein